MVLWPTCTDERFAKVSGQGGTASDIIVLVDAPLKNHYGVIFLTNNHQRLGETERWGFSNVDVSFAVFNTL